MTSGSFTIAEQTRRDACIRMLLGAVLIVIIIVAIFIGFLAFKTSQEALNGCPNPELDPYGMSNWTEGSESVAFGCFPGHDLEGHADNMPIVSHCVDNQWVPAPPACAAIPMRMDCAVEQNGLEGTISMWQESKSTPTLIYGVLNITDVDRSKAIFSDNISLSRTTCFISADMNLTMPPVKTTPEQDIAENRIQVRFSSTQLQAYKKANIRVNLVFVDSAHNMVASIVSVTQGDTTLMMKTTIPKEWHAVDGSSSSSSNGLIEGSTEPRTTPPPTILTYDDTDTEATESDPDTDPAESLPVPEQ